MSCSGLRAMGVTCTDVPHDDLSDQAIITRALRRLALLPERIV